MEIHFANGSILFINNFLTFIVVTVALFYFCWKVNAKKFDKALHCLISAVLTGVLIFAFGFIHLWWLSPIAVLLIGFGKELLDLINPKKKLFDWNDILADVIGVSSVSLAYLFSFILH